MKGFVQGSDRQQTTLLPECLDDWVDEGNSIRAVDVFVDALELRDLGFDGVDPAATGRPAYWCRLLRIAVALRPAIARRPSSHCRAPCQTAPSWGARSVPPLASNAQATHAILLASATATTLNGRRARSCVSQGYFSGCWRARRKTAWAPTMRMRRRYWSPCFEIGPSFCLPPVESCRGTIPIQAAKSRPDRKTLGSGTTAAIV